MIAPIQLERTIQVVRFAQRIRLAVVLGHLCFIGLQLPTYALQLAPCSGRPLGQLASATKPKAAAETGHEIAFEDVFERSGIDFQLKNSISPQRYSIETMTGGVA